MSEMNVVFIECLFFPKKNKNTSKKKFIIWDPTWIDLAPMDFHSQCNITDHLLLDSTAGSVLVELLL